MPYLRVLSICTILAVFAVGFGCAPATEPGETPSEGTEAAMDMDSDGGAPTYGVDASWPKDLPNNWLLGQVGGIAVDSRDHIWIAHRPGSLDDAEYGATADPPFAECCEPAPPIIEFDQEGNVVQAWGGPGEGFDWPNNEHGIFVDHMDNVWTAGNGGDDSQVLKFSRDGTFLLQIGAAGPSEGSNSTTQLGRPADIEVDPETNELWVADGYGNRRVIVFDADTGEYKRHWGAYGNTPNDDDDGGFDPNADPREQSSQFRSPVHCVRIADDGLVYVCDRGNNRIQVFQKDGTFVEEVFIAKMTGAAGSTWDVDLSPDQVYLYNGDGVNMKVWILDRQGLGIVGSFGRHGRQAGQFHWLHNLAVDSQGNIYTAEVSSGMRVQKFSMQ